jgi:hypothetical protein
MAEAKFALIQKTPGEPRRFFYLTVEVLAIVKGHTLRIGVARIDCTRGCCMRLSDLMA